MKKKRWYWLVLFSFYALSGAGKDIVGAKSILIPRDTSYNVYTESIFSEAYVLNAFAAQLYINKGIFRMKEENYELAISDFQQALHLNPGSFEAYSLLGEAMVALDLKSEALKAFDKAIDLNPFYASAYFNRANLFHNLGNDHEAFNDYAIAKYIDPIYLSLLEEKILDRLTSKKSLKNEFKISRK